MAFTRQATFARILCHKRIRWLANDTNIWAWAHVRGATVFVLLCVANMPYLIQCNKERLMCFKLSDNTISTMVSYCLWDDSLRAYPCQTVLMFNYLLTNRSSIYQNNMTEVGDITLLLNAGLMIKVNF